MPDVRPGQAVPAADPVSMISALLDAEKVTPNPPPETPAEAQAEEQEYQPDPKNAEPEGEDVKPEEEGIPLEQLEAIELEVEVSGDTGKVVKKLPIKELKLGYMRQQDYQTKTAEVARQRTEVRENVRQAVESERTQYAENLQKLETMLIEAVAPELKNVDWNHLAANDQFEYIRLKNRADQVTQALQSVKSKQTEVHTKAEADKRQALLETAQKTWATLEADIPGWNGDMYNALINSSRHGVKRDVLASLTDAGVIAAIYRLDQLQAGKPAADKKVVSVPKVIKPGAPAAPKAGQKQASAVDRLRKSGKIEDLAAVIASRM